MTQKAILVSFIIPIYNVEPYLNRCLKSVTAIKNENIEIILVDDGSTDGSSLIYERYAKADKRITIIKKENGGVSSARNRGIEKAKGKWISFIDGDDEIIPEVYDSYLLKLNDTAELWMLGCVTRDLDTSYFEREIIGGTWSDEKIELLKESLFFQDSLFAKSMKGQGINIYGPYAKFYQKQIISERNILFPENVAIGEDRIFTFHYLKYVDSIEYTSRCGYFYWQNRNSVMNQYKSEKGKQSLEQVEYIYNLSEPIDVQIYSQFGVRQYLYALKIEWCNPNNPNNYFSRKADALKWRNMPFVQEAFTHIKLSQIRWEAIPIAFCAKRKCFFLCNMLLKIKAILPIKFK